MTIRRIDVGHTPLAGLDRLGRHLEYQTERQAVIAANVANLDTPGYRARDVRFSEQVELQVRPDGIVHTIEHETEAVVADDEVPDQDGNTVALEGQVAKMKANMLRYRSVSELLSRRIGMLRYAASDGNA